MVNTRYGVGNPATFQALRTQEGHPHEWGKESLGRIWRVLLGILLLDKATTFGTSLSIKFSLHAMRILQSASTK
jgi:hypothetical protein